MKWRRIVLTVLGVVLAGAAAILFVGDRQRSAAAAQWPSVEGRITASAIDVQQRSGRRSRDRYVPRLRYDYRVAGRSFSNDRIWLSETRNWKTRAGAEEAIAAFPAGAAVPVFYDPANPADSALIVKGVVWPFVIMFLAGILVIGLGFIPNLRRRRGTAGRA
ncbi:MAG: hypothetical protein QOD42_1250 [Sphingomonadales bacterium]|jgi:hypothetical protein|nr:hypothetical protein [Sphingomonadales bacterium]